MKTLTKISIIIIFLFMRISFAQGQYLTAGQITTLGRSVVKIKVILPNGRQKIASGFIHSSQDIAVTAYHVVAGATSVIVRYENDMVERSGTVIKVLKRADLALIRISSPLSVNPLPLASGQASINQQLTALGFYLDAVSMDQRRLSMSASQKIGNVLPSKNLQEIQNTGCPSIDLVIHKLQDNPLLPGFSGCPVFNGSGEVIGIGDGGLENGAYSISWAIPASHISALMNSTENFTGSAIQSTSYFSADVISPGEIETISVAGLTFTKLRTRSLADLATSSATDDLNGLHQILSTFPQAIDKSKIFFDIYQDVTSGAVIVIPADMQYQVTGNTIRVFDSSNRHETRVVVARNLTPVEMQQHSVNFEGSFYNPATTWMPDPAFTYLAPVMRPDGLTVRRKAFVAWSTPTTTERYLIETFAYKQGTFLSVGNVKKDYNTFFMNARFNCLQTNFGGTGCDNMLQDLTTWGAMIVATHLTSFSI